MFSDELYQKISSLCSDLPLITQIKRGDEWEEFLARVHDLTESFTAIAEFSMADVTARAEELLYNLSVDKINQPQEAIKHIIELFDFVCHASKGSEIDHGALKQAVATADMYLDDLTSAEEDISDAPQIDEEFMNELEGRIDRLENTLFQTTDGESDKNKVKAIFREYHTLKGEAGILGLAKLSEFWHGVEEPIESARNGEMVLTRTIIDCLLELTKYGRNLLRKGSLSENERSFVDDSLKILNQAVGKSPDAPKQKLAAAPIDFRTSDPHDKDEENEDVQTFSSEDDEDDFFAQGGSTAGAGEDEDDFFAEKSSQPVQYTDEDDDFFATKDKTATIEVTAEPFTPNEETVYTPETVTETVNAAEEAPSAVESSEADPAPPPQPERAAIQPAPSSTPVKAATPENGDSQEVPETSMKYVNIEVHKLDQLLDLVGEVALVGSHLSGNPEVNKIVGISTDLQDLQRFCRSLHDMTAGLRMTTIAPLFQRVQRAAMDAARPINKRVVFKIKGADTQVDRMVIDKLSAALVHMARNSVDHGLESQEERRELGKPAQGQITLSAKRSGADIIIEFSDDGRGLDIKQIIAKAKKTGLIAEDETPTTEQACMLIFSQGLSTAQSVTGLSGRGVGMAVVKESAESLRGHVEIDNNYGKGVTFRLKFPVALAAVETLLVKLGENTLAMPIQSIRETFKVTAEQLSSVEGKGNIVNLRGVIVPVINLSEQLGIAAESDGKPENGVLVLVEEGEKLAAVLVDDVLETRQVVIRPLEGNLQDIPDITGAALLSDRQVALVLDMRRLVEKVFVCSGTSFSDASMRQAMSERQVETVSVGSNSVGIIDFSINTRKKDNSVVTHTFAINAFKTREFVPVTKLVMVPDMPAGFAGMLTLRNETIPVMELDTLLGFVKAEERTGEFDEIIIICEFSGVTVGFLVSNVNSVSYVTWDDIKSPPESGSQYALKYVIGTIQLSCLREDLPEEQKDAIGFLLDFERIVQQILDLYGDIGSELGDVQLRKDCNRILLVEDSPLIRRETAKSLKNAGLEVIEAENGKEALAIIEKLYAEAKREKKSLFNYIDLILSDIEMPQMDGYSLTRHIKNHPDMRLIPTLLHSSLTNETIVNRAKEVHADGFVPKCDPHQLAEHLRRYL